MSIFPVFPTNLGFPKTGFSSLSSVSFESLRAMASWSSAIRPSLSRPHVDQLPTELLTEIFNMAVHDRSLHHPKHTDHPVLDDHFSEASSSGLQELDFQPAINVGTPFTIAAVCRRWRQIATETPSLWTSISVSVQDITCSDDSEEEPSILPIESRILWQISRSRDKLLDVLIDARDDEWRDCEDVYEHLRTFNPDITGFSPSEGHPFSSDHMEYFLTLLLTQLSRWKSLTILTDTWGPMHTALRILHRPPHLLDSYNGWSTPRHLESVTLVRSRASRGHSAMNYQHLPMQGYVPENVYNSGFFPLDFGHRGNGSPLPSLKKLTLDGTHIRWQDLPRCLSPPESSRLERLDISLSRWRVGPSLGDLTRLLRSVRFSLRTLVLHSGSPRMSRAGDQISLSEPIVMEQLKTMVLSYSCGQPGIIVSLVSLLEAPGLVSLSVEGLTQHREEGAQVSNGRLLQALSRSSSSISTSTSLTSSSPATSSMIKFPALKNLKLSGIDASRHAFRDLFESLTHLTRLEIVTPCSGKLDGQVSQWKSPPTANAEPVLRQTELITLQIESRPCAFLDALFATPRVFRRSTQQPASIASPFLPALRTLVVRGTTLQADDTVWALLRHVRRYNERRVKHGWKVLDSVFLDLGVLKGEAGGLSTHVGSTVFVARTLRVGYGYEVDDKRIDSNLVED